MKRIILALPFIVNPGLMAMKKPLQEVLRHYYLECATPTRCARCPQQCTTRTQCSTCPTEFVKDQVIKNKELRNEHSLLNDVFATTVATARQHYPQQTWPTKPLFAKEFIAPTVPQTCFRTCYVALRESNASLKTANVHLADEVEKLVTRFYAQGCKKKEI